MDIIDLSVKIEIITKGEISIKMDQIRGEISTKEEILIKMVISKEEILIRTEILIKVEIIILEGEWLDLHNGTEIKIQIIEKRVGIVDYSMKGIDATQQIKIVIIATGKVISNVCVEVDISIIDSGILGIIKKYFLIEIMDRLKTTGE